MFLSVGTREGNRAEHRWVIINQTITCPSLVRLGIFRLLLQLSLVCTQTVASLFVEIGTQTS
jgi:hypothetical protein